MGRFRRAAPSLGDEHSFLTFLSGVWSLLKDCAAAWLLANTCFFPSSQKQPATPYTPRHMHEYTQALSPQSPRGPRVHAGLGGSSCRNSGRGFSELPPASPPSASGLSEPLCWARVLVLAHRVPAPAPFTWAACFQQSWPHPGEPQCVLPASVTRGEAAGLERFSVRFSKARSGTRSETQPSREDGLSAG